MARTNYVMNYARKCRNYELKRLHTSRRNVGIYREGEVMTYKQVFIILGLMVGGFLAFLLVLRQFDHRQYVRWCSDFGRTYSREVRFEDRNFMDYECMTVMPDGSWMSANSQLPHLAESER